MSDNPYKIIDGEKVFLTDSEIQRKTQSYATSLIISALALRRSRYLVESDPLYMEWQYDQTPGSEQSWRDAVAQIKLDIPLV